ncbi:MAG TPA: CHAT domain-containing protein [Blastocatellia bacterium]|nr:CHAT domain-containing protein [Blastocatellia bacterium]
MRIRAVLAARLEFESFQTALYTLHPELQVPRGEIRPVSLEEAAALLPDSHSALLDFVVTEERVHLFVLTKDNSEAVRLNAYSVRIQHKLLAEKVERFRRRLANRDIDFQGFSRELYNLLLRPAQSQLRAKTSLLISPDSVLWDLPFQVLRSGRNWSSTVRFCSIPPIAGGPILDRGGRDLLRALALGVEGDADRAAAADGDGS